MKTKIVEWIKKETVLVVAWVLALLSMFLEGKERKRRADGLYYSVNAGDSCGTLRRRLRI